jgi:hypothetical protein
MPEAVLNGAVTIIWALVMLYLVIRFMESRAFEYSLRHTETGLVFEYRLGVYSGRITMVRDSNAVIPTIQQVMGGWKLKFPTDYSFKEMCLFAQGHIKRGMESASHSKDLLIFDEVVNKHNDALVSINGRVYCYDNSDHKPY